MEGGREGKRGIENEKKMSRTIVTSEKARDFAVTNEGQNYLVFESAGLGLRRPGF